MGDLQHGIAARLEGALAPLLKGPLPVRMTAWDGSQAGRHSAALAADPRGPRPRPRFVITTPPSPPASQARLRGRRHTLLRDRSAISHHYDLSNDFYAQLLDPTMA